MGSGAAKQPCWEAKGDCVMKCCAMAGAGVGFKDDLDQMMEVTPLVVAVQLVDGLRGCFSHKTEVQHSWPLLV